jgi:hypothetical protein
VASSTPPRRRSSRARPRARATPARATSSGDAVRRVGGRADLDRCARLDVEGRARGRRAVGDHRPTPVPAVSTDPAPATTVTAAPTAPTPVATSTSHDEGSARNRLGERGVQIDRDAVGVEELGVTAVPRTRPTVPSRRGSPLR